MGAEEELVGDGLLGFRAVVGGVGEGYLVDGPNAGGALDRGQGNGVAAGTEAGRGGAAGRVVEGGGGGRVEFSLGGGAGRTVGLGKEESVGAGVYEDGACDVGQSSVLSRSGSVGLGLVLSTYKF